MTSLILAIAATSTLASTTTSSVTTSASVAAGLDDAATHIAASPPPSVPEVATPPAETYKAPKSQGLVFEQGNWRLRVLAQYWARFIGDSGRDFLDSEFQEYVGQRARLGAGIQHTNGFGARVLLQDVRTWGEELNSLNDFSANGFDVQEAYVDLPLFGFGRLRLGRQEVVVDDARLVGNVIWTLRARSFDGIRFDTAWGNLKLNLLYAKLRERDQNPDGNVAAAVPEDRDLAVGHAIYTLGSQHSLKFTYVLDLVDGADRARHTFGPAFMGRTGLFDYRADAVVQLSGLSGSNESAFFIAGKLGVSPDVAGKPRIGVFVDVLSSDGTAAGTFDTLFATNHKFYGEMDLFLNIPVHTQGRGLINPGVQASLQPMDRLKLKLTWHNFLAYADGSAGALLGSRFGDEIDLKAVVQIMDHVQLRGLYGVFFPQDSLSARFGVGADNVAHFVYLTLAAGI